MCVDKKFCITLKELTKKSLNWTFWILFIVLTLYFVQQLCLHWYCLYDLAKNDDLWYFITAMATALIAWIAYYKLSKIEHVQKTSFLMQIDERWHSKEILEARTIIHKFYKRHSPSDDEEFVLENVCNKVGNEFKELSKIGSGTIPKNKNTLQDYKEFMQILNLLDFMETIGLMYREEQVSINQLEALCGESLSFNYMIFESYIYSKRCKHKNNSYYEYFERLYRDIQKKKLCE